MRMCQKHNTKRNKWGQCLECAREWRRSPSGKESLRNHNKLKSAIKAKKKYNSSKKKRKTESMRRNDPEVKWRRNATNHVYRAIKRGELVKKPCVVCGNNKSEAHHAWGYNRKHLLHVIFLCRKHHNQADQDHSFNEQIKKGIE